MGAGRDRFFVPDRRQKTKFLPASTAGRTAKCATPAETRAYRAGYSQVGFTCTRRTDSKLISFCDGPTVALLVTARLYGFLGRADYQLTTACRDIDAAFCAAIGITHHDHRFPACSSNLLRHQLVSPACCRKRCTKCGSIHLDRRSRDTADAIALPLTAPRLVHR